MATVVKKTNPLNDKQFERLCESIDYSERQLVYPREKRIEAIKQYIGFHYSEDGAVKRVPVNFLKLAVKIYVRSLAARAPRVLITTKEERLKSTAANLELAINQIPPEIELQTTLRRVVTEALFSFGVIKCGLHTVGEMLGHNYGAPFVDVVTIDDFIIDMAVKRFDLIQYIGDTYWLDFEEAQESKEFKNTEDLKPDDYTVIGEHGEERAEGIGTESSPKLFKDKVLFRDVWLPADKLLVTYAVKTKKRMKVIEWDGPERGPYSILGFDEVPGNLLPLPPVATWRGLHELANILFRKLGDQADAQKTVQGFQGDDDAVLNFKNAKDGDGIMFTGSEPKTLKAGGIEPTTLAFFLQCKDLYSYLAGNLNSLGGLSPQAETLGQDRLLSAASNAQLRDMAALVVDFTKDIFKSLAYYEWHDPVRKRQLTKPIPGTNFSIPVAWDRKARRGKFELYNLDIDVFSLQDNSPDIKLQKLGLMMQQYILPLMPAIQQAGGTLDVQTLIEMVAKLSDLPELSEIVQFIEQSDMPAAHGAMEPSGSTTKRYERVSRPGATESGKSQILQQALLGGQPQTSETAAIGRPTG